MGDIVVGHKTCVAAVISSAMSDLAGRDGNPPNTQLRGGDLGRFGGAGDDSQNANASSASTSRSLSVSTISWWRKVLRFFGFDG